MINARTNLLDHDRVSLEAWFNKLDEFSFRASQVLKWIYHYGMTNFSGMTNLSKTLRARLSAIASIDPPEIISVRESADGTRKWLLRVDQKNAVEMVFIPEDDRGTLCVSSQAGCALGCTFCATARQGFGRNLTTAEIIGQVWLANRELGYFRHRRRVITNVVFMGMGEPLLNYANVLKAINLLTEEAAFGLAKRKVTLSTAGIVPGIDKLSRDASISLAVSLHAVENELRNRLVPINRHYAIEDLLAACRRYTITNNDLAITMEYIMLHNINDKPEHARKLIKLLRDLPVKINLIPFNPIFGSAYRCSTPEAMDAFRMILVNAGMIAITRKTRGDDIDAACGQLVGRVKIGACRDQPPSVAPAS